MLNVIKLRKKSLIINIKRRPLVYKHKNAFFVLRNQKNKPMVKANVQIINDLKTFLNKVISDITQRQQYTFSESDFSRKRTLPLETLAMLILNLPKRSLSIEICSFFDFIKQESCTKSAFCQQRTKLKSVFSDHGIIFSFVVLSSL